MSPALFRLTHSKMQRFRRCRKQYWFADVSGLEWPPAVDSPAALVGNAVHRAMQKLCETDDPRDGEHELDLYLRMPKHEMAGPDTPHYAEAMEIFGHGVEAHRSVESELRFAETDSWVPLATLGVTVRAKADRVDRLAPGRWQVIDWKTGRYDLDDAVDEQLDLAHVVVRTIRRVPREAAVRAIGWNLRTGQQRVRELTREDAARTAGYLGRFGAMLQATTEFPASPGPACGFCAWRERCEDAASLGSDVNEWLFDEPAAEEAPW